MTRHNAWECSVAGGGTTVLAKKLERNFPQNFMKLVTDVYEKRSAVSLKVESCMTVLLESYWIIIGESWVATLFSCPPHRIYSFRCFLNVIWKVLGMNLTKFFKKQYNFKSKCRVPLQFALKLRSKLRSTLCSLLWNYEANCEAPFAVSKQTTKHTLQFQSKLQSFFVLWWKLQRKVWNCKVCFVVCFETAKGASQFAS